MFVIATDETCTEVRPWYLATLGVSLLGHAVAVAGIVLLTSVSWIGWPVAALSAVGVGTATALLHRRLAVGERATSTILSVTPAGEHLVLRRLTGRVRAPEGDLSFGRAVANGLIRHGGLVFLIPADEAQAAHARRVGFRPSRYYPAPVLAMRTYEGEKSAS